MILNCPPEHFDCQTDPTLLIRHELDHVVTKRHKRMDDGTTGGANIIIFPYAVVFA